MNVEVVKDSGNINILFFGCHLLRVMSSV